MNKLLIFHVNSNSYYKNIVFNSLKEKYGSFKVIFLSESRKSRKWKLNHKDLKFPFKTLFKGDLEDVNKVSLIKRVLKTLREENPDVLYLGGYSQIAYWSALIWSKIKRKKVILEMDSNIYNLGKKTFYKEFFKKFFVKMCDYGITYGELSKEYFIKLGMPEEKIVIKPNVTDNEFWEKETEKYSRKRDEIIRKEGFKNKNFIYVGRFAPEKNLFFLLDAFKEIKKSKEAEGWGLIMVGDGSQREELMKYVEKEKIKDVFFIPFKQKEELPKYYAISDVLLLPSLSETWGIVVNEAMASGLIPLVSKRCGAIDLLKPCREEFVFDPLNLNDFIEKIKRVMNFLERDFHKNKIVKNIHEYTTDYASNKMLELIRKVKAN